MFCHKCPHSAEIDRLREICTRCKLGDACAVSGTYSLDNMTEGAIDDPSMKARRAAGVKAHNELEPFFDEPPAPETPEQQARDTFITLLADLSAVQFERLRDLLAIVRAFEGLDKKEFQLVQHFLNGGTMTSYAHAFGLSKQTAHARCKALFRHKPVFKAIANGLLGKLKGGRKPAKRTEEQTFFDFGESAKRDTQAKQ